MLRYLGARRGWAWAQLLCLAALVAVDGVLLATRATHKQSFVEEG